MLTFLRLSQAIHVDGTCQLYSAVVEYQNEENLTFPDAIDLNS